MTSPSNIKSPTTDHKGEHNCKSRQVYCQWCKYILTTDIPGPKCGNCGEPLIVMPQSKVCPLCKGTGRIGRLDECPWCHGKGQLKDDFTG